MVVAVYVHSFLTSKCVDCFSRHQMMSVQVNKKGTEGNPSHNLQTPIPVIVVIRAADFND